MRGRRASAAPAAAKPTVEMDSMSLTTAARSTRSTPARSAIARPSRSRGMIDRSSTAFMIAAASSGDEPRLSRRSLLMRALFFDVRAGFSVATRTCVGFSPAPPALAAAASDASGPTRDSFCPIRKTRPPRHGWALSACALQRLACNGDSTRLIDAGHVTQLRNSLSGPGGRRCVAAFSRRTAPHVVLSCVFAASARRSTTGTEWI